jgi:hypothetical protein
MEEKKTKTKKSKDYFKKRGLRFLKIGGALIVLYIIIHFSGALEGESLISALVFGSIIAIISLGGIICLLIGIVYVIMGFTKKA